MGLRPTRGDEKRFSSNYPRWKPCPPLRSSEGAEWRDLRSSGPFLGMFFDRAQRSGEICSFSGPFLEMVLFPQNFRLEVPVPERSEPP
jgi:hypothetical protein